MSAANILSQFNDQGFVVIKNVFNLERDLKPLISDYSNLIDDLADRLYAEGRLTSSFRELPFGERIVKLISESDASWYQHFDISLPLSNVSEETPIHLSEAVFNLLRNPRLLDAVEMFMGPEIYVNPVQHVRIKPPERIVSTAQQNTLVVRTEWHQDQGVILPEADETRILTVWLPVMDATEENGCLTVVPTSHRNDLITHCPGVQLHIPGSLLSSLGPSAVPVPMKAGSVLFMHQRTVHASLSNLSNAIRWSFDLRYQPIGLPTGRPAFPGFIGRSRKHPEAELSDYRVWRKLWIDARKRLAQQTLPSFHRWSGDGPLCA
jgi:phytanoyl-CoA hydroxylase